MGCGYSCKKRNQPTCLTPMFKVTNVDAVGKQIYRGKLEVNADNLTLHVIGIKSPIVWPLSSIRQYGYDESMFCFEADQSAPYGPEGIFPFKSTDAKIIFDNIKEISKVMHDAQLAKDIASEQPTTSMHTIERPYENGVVFNGIKWSMDMEFTNNTTVPPQQSVQIKPVNNAVVSSRKPMHIEHRNNGPILPQNQIQKSTHIEHRNNSLILPQKQMQKSTHIENWNNGPVLPQKQLQKSTHIENWNNGPVLPQKQIRKSTHIENWNNGPVLPQKQIRKSTDIENWNNGPVLPQKQVQKSLQIKPMFNRRILSQNEVQKAMKIQPMYDNTILPQKQVQNLMQIKPMYNSSILPQNQIEKSMKNQPMYHNTQPMYNGPILPKKQVQKSLQIKSMINESGLPQKSMPVEPMSDEAISLQTPYTNVFYNHRKPENSPNNAQETSEDTLIYTELEFAPYLVSNRKPPSPVERTHYSTIDFKWTANLNRKMFKCSDNTGTRKTRHDSSLSD